MRMFIRYFDEICLMKNKGFIVLLVLLALMLSGQVMAQERIATAVLSQHLTFTGKEPSIRQSRC